jgi:LacI family transcriptional regulator, galactose operon repressor
MGKRSGTPGGRKADNSTKAVTLKQLAEYVGLAPATVSLVLNKSVEVGIAPATRELVLGAARKLNYRPSYLARSLRMRRSFTIGVMVPEINEGYNVEVLRGIERHLQQEGYFYFVVSHRFKTDLLQEYLELFENRMVDGLIVVCAPWHLQTKLPVATVSCHHNLKGTTKIIVDHDAAAEIVLRHLMNLGHRKIAFIKGTPAVPDTKARWQGIVRAAARLGLPLSSKLVVPIGGTCSSPHLGYDPARKLLASGESFTALVAFNDVSAIGAIRALNDRSLRVPEDISVVGFDDIESAAFQARGLTTVRQPLTEMGESAARSVLRRIAKPDPKSKTEEIVVAPELVIRETTNAVATSKRKRRMPEQVAI